MATVDIGPALLRDELLEEGNTPWEVQHPPQLTVERILHGFRTQRWGSIDVGQIRTTLLLTECHGHLEIGKLDHEVLVDICKELGVHNFDDSEASDKKLGAKLKKGPATWLLRSKAYARQIDPIAIYIINLRRATVVCWIHPLVMEREVEPLRSLVTDVPAFARIRREEAVPRYTFMDEYETTKDPYRTKKSFYTGKFYKNALLPPTERVSAEQRGYDMIALARSMNELLFKPEFAPLFIYLGPVVIENQPDIVRRYVTTADRDGALLKTLAEAIPHAKTAEIQHLLIAHYEKHLGLAIKEKDSGDRENYGPINWGLSNMFITAIHAISRFYGHQADRPVVFVASKGISEFEQHAGDKAILNQARPDATKHYDYLKKAAETVWKPFYTAKEKQDPEIYTGLLDKMAQSVVRSAHHRDEVKMDDITDPTGQSIVAIERYTRETPYRGALDSETITEANDCAYAALLWKNAHNRVTTRTSSYTAASKYGKIVGMQQRMVMGADLDEMAQRKRATAATKKAAAAPAPAKKASAVSNLTPRAPAPPKMIEIDLTQSEAVTPNPPARPPVRRPISRLYDDDADDNGEAQVQRAIPIQKKRKRVIAEADDGDWEAPSTQATSSSSQQSSFGDLDMLYDAASNAHKKEVLPDGKVVRQLQLVKPAKSNRVRLSEIPPRAKKSAAPLAGAPKKGRPAPSAATKIASKVATAPPAPKRRKVPVNLRDDILEDTYFDTARDSTSYTREKTWTSSKYTDSSAAQEMNTSRRTSSAPSSTEWRSAAAFNTYGGLD